MQYFAILCKTFKLKCKIHHTSGRYFCNVRHVLYSTSLMFRCVWRFACTIGCLISWGLHCWLLLIYVHCIDLTMVVHSVKIQNWFSQEKYYFWKLNTAIKGKKGIKQKRKGKGEKKDLLQGSKFSKFSSLSQTAVQWTLCTINSMFWCKRQHAVFSNLRTHGFLLQIYLKFCCGEVNQVFDWCKAVSEKFLFLGKDYLGMTCSNCCSWHHYGIILNSLTNCSSKLSCYNCNPLNFKER